MPQDTPFFIFQSLDFWLFVGPSYCPMFPINQPGAVCSLSSWSLHLGQGPIWSDVPEAEQDPQCCATTRERGQVQILAGIRLPVPFCSHCRLQAALGSRDKSGPNFPSSLKYHVYFGQVKEHCQKLGLRQRVLLHLFGNGNNVQFWECSENFAKVDVILMNWKPADYPD